MKNLSNPGTTFAVAKFWNQAWPGSKQTFVSRIQSPRLATPSNVQLAQVGTAWTGSEQFPHGPAETPHPVH